MREWPLLAWNEPLWLLLALAPLPLWLLWRRGGSAGERLRRWIDPRLLARLTRGHGSRAAPRLLVALWLLLAVAAAGPYLPREPAPGEPLPAANVALIVDISPSMGVADVEPDRITQARRQLAAFARALEGSRIALIGFSANAYAILPLTADRHTVGDFIEVLDPTLVTVAGSNLARALALAAEALDAPPPGETSPPPGLAILVSDGEIHDAEALEEARRLAAAGHRLFTVGVGTESGGPVPQLRGQLARQGGEIHTSRRQRATLRALAAAGGGSYHDLGPEAWEALEREVAGLKRARYLERHAPQRGLPLYPWLAALALLLLLGAMWRHPGRLALLLVAPTLFALPGPGEAAPWEALAAHRALERGDAAEALRLYRRLDDFEGRLGSGVAAYRLGDFETARAAFEAALAEAGDPAQRASAAYNLGTTLIRLGRLEEAERALSQALLHRPDHPGARRNLELLRRYLEQAGAESSGEGAGTLEAASAARGRTDREAKGQEGTGGADGAFAEASRRWLAGAAEDAGDGPEGGEVAPLLARQRLRTLDDDTTTMLRRRFSIEDERAIGLIEERPW